MEYDKHKIKFKDFIELKRGYDLPTKDRIEGNIPIISSSGVSGKHHIEKVLSLIHISEPTRRS